jgi:E3 ubiquitin-protein ligase SIAH1
MSHGLIAALEDEDIKLSAPDINLPGPVTWVDMLSRFGHHFIVVLDKPKASDGHQQFFATVQLIGTRKQAENLVYRLELNGQRRRMTWEATPRSIHEGISSAIMNSDCLVLNACTAQLLADKGKLSFNVSISMV